MAHYIRKSVKNGENDIVTQESLLHGPLHSLQSLLLDPFIVLEGKEVYSALVEWLIFD